MAQATLLLLGYGNMARAIFSNNPYFSKHYAKVLVSGRDEQKTLSFIHAHAPYAMPYISESSLDSENPKPIINIEGKDILLCQKPKGLSSFVYKGKARRVYSVMAGVELCQIAQEIDAQTYIRLMPNIAASEKCSATAYFTHFQDVAEAHREGIQSEISEFIGSFGKAVWVDSEHLIDSSIATSGSAIAFLSIVAEALVDAGVSEGLDFKSSQELVRGCFEGFAKVYAHKSPSELKYAISSPGGTTIEGLNLLEAHGVRGAFIKAARASVAKAKGGSNAAAKAPKSQSQNLQSPSQILNSCEKQE